MHVLGEAVRLVAIEIHHVRKLAGKRRVPGEIGNPDVLIGEVVQIRRPGFFPRPFAVESRGSRSDFVESHGFSEALQAHQETVFAQHFFRGFPSGPLVGLGTPPIVQRRTDDVHVFVAGPIVFEGRTKRHVFANRSVELAMDERGRLVGNRVFGRQIERIDRKDHLKSRFGQGVEPRELAHVAERATEVRGMRGPRIPTPVHLVHGSEKHLHVELAGGSEKPRVRSVKRSRSHLRRRESERRDGDVVDAAGSKKRDGAAELGIGTGSIVVVDDGDGGDFGSGIPRFDSEDLFGKVVLRAKPRLYQHGRELFYVQRLDERTGGDDGTSGSRSGRNGSRSGIAGRGESGVRQSENRKGNGKKREGFRKGSEGLRHREKTGYGQTLRKS